MPHRTAADRRRELEVYKDEAAAFDLDTHVARSIGTGRSIRTLRRDAGQAKEAATHQLQRLVQQHHPEFLRIAGAVRSVLDDVGALKAEARGARTAVADLSAVTVSSTAATGLPPVTAASAPAAPSFLSELASACAPPPTGAAGTARERARAQREAAAAMAAVEEAVTQRLAMGDYAGAAADLRALDDPDGPTGNPALLALEARVVEACLAALGALPPRAFAQHRPLLQLLITLGRGQQASTFFLDAHRAWLVEAVAALPAAVDVAESVAGATDVVVAIVSHCATAHRALLRDAEGAACAVWVREAVEWLARDVVAPRLVGALIAGGGDASFVQTATTIVGRVASSVATVGAVGCGGAGLTVAGLLVSSVAQVLAGRVDDLASRLRIPGGTSGVMGYDGAMAALWHSWAAGHDQGGAAQDVITAAMCATLPTAAWFTPEVAHDSPWPHLLRAVRLPLHGHQYAASVTAYYAALGSDAVAADPRSRGPVERLRELRRVLDGCSVGRMCAGLCDTCLTLLGPLAAVSNATKSRAAQSDDERIAHAAVAQSPELLARLDTGLQHLCRQVLYDVRAVRSSLCDNVAVFLTRCIDAAPDDAAGDDDTNVADVALGDDDFAFDAAKAVSPTDAALLGNAVCAATLVRLLVAAFPLHFPAAPAPQHLRSLERKLPGFVRALAQEMALQASPLTAVDLFLGNLSLLSTAHTAAGADSGADSGLTASHLARHDGPGAPVAAGTDPSDTASADAHSAAGTAMSCAQTHRARKAAQHRRSQALAGAVAQRLADVSVETPGQQRQLAMLRVCLSDHSNGAVGRMRRFFSFAFTGDVADDAEPSALLPVVLLVALNTTALVEHTARHGGAAAGAAMGHSVLEALLDDLFLTEAFWAAQYDRPDLFTAADTIGRPGRGTRHILGQVAEFLVALPHVLEPLADVAAGIGLSDTEAPASRCAAFAARSLGTAHPSYSTALRQVGAAAVLEYELFADDDATDTGPEEEAETVSLRAVRARLAAALAPLR